MVLVRKADKNDALFIIEFQKMMAWETERLMLRDDLITEGVKAVFGDKTKGQYYVAESGGKVIASMLITNEWSDWRNAFVWWFQSVYVLPSFRRQGVFKAMYRFVRDEAIKNNIAGLRLYVEKNNTTAQKAYEKLGMNGEHYSMFEWLKE